MRVCLDLDGVVYDFNGACRFLLERHFGVSVPREWTHWNAPIEFLREQGFDGDAKPDAWKWLWLPNGGIGAGLFRHGHVLKGAVSAAHDIVQAGHELVVITARPKSATVDTLAWLGFHNLPVTEFHLVADVPKSAVRPECDVYVDDSLSNCLDLVENTDGTVLLWDQPWNRNRWQHNVLRDKEREGRFGVLNSWADALECILWRGNE